MMTNQHQDRWKQLHHIETVTSVRCKARSCLVVLQLKLESLLAEGCSCWEEPALSQGATDAFALLQLGLLVATPLHKKTHP